jgi:glycosyltransferase involved in cell wall biosynthesis
MNSNNFVVVHYQRKPRKTGNYSVETIFQDVRKRLQDLKFRVVEAPYFSNGVFKRLAIMVHAACCQADVNHVTGDINFACILLRPNRCVLTILDCLDAETKRGLGGWLFRKLWFQWPVKRCAVITTISEASKGDIVRITGCHPDKVVVTSVAISDQFKRIDRTFHQDCPTILQVGTSKNKNIERLAAALEGIKCRLVVIGRLSDSQHASLVQNKIQFENLVGLSDAELLQQYDRCDVVAFASVLEGFGMPIVEGNTVGRVVVTGNRTSMPEVAGDAACLVNPYDIQDIRNGFLRVINDAAYRNALIEKGFKNAERFGPAKIAGHYRNVYEFVARREPNKTPVVLQK